MPNNRIKTTFMLNGVDLIFDNMLSVSFELLVVFGFERKKKNAYIALKNKADNVYKNENSRPNIKAETEDAIMVAKSNTII